MKYALYLAIAAVVALAPVLMGCAEDDVDREAAYPQPIGYTSPAPATGSTPNVYVADSTSAQAAPPAQAVVSDYASGEQPVTPEAGQDYADTDPSALTDFRDTLDPYGSWVSDPTYGDVWVPSQSVVGDDFTPYQSAGHWDYDDDQYTWVSDYDWGWAPFHYGRWVYDGPYGWEWIPGRVYAGAWVSWRYGYGDWGYVGWAPMAPYWGWRGGRAFGLGFVPAEPYGFCASGNLFAPHVSGSIIAGAQGANIGAHTRPWTTANPTVNGRVTATPRVNGPPPQVMHIAPGAVAHGALANRGVFQAQAFARAGSASALGARMPQQGYAGTGQSGRSGAYASNPNAASHFGGKFGSGFRGDLASSRPTYSGYGAYGSRGAYGGGSTGYGTRAATTFRGGYSGYGSGGYRGGYTGGFTGGSGFHPATSGHSGGGFSGDGGYSGVTHGGGGFSGGSRGGSFGGGGGGFHGGGGFSGGGGHGGFGGGGGGHGGGGHR